MLLIGSQTKLQNNCDGRTKLSGLVDSQDNLQGPTYNVLLILSIQCPVFSFIIIIIFYFQIRRFVKSYKKFSAPSKHLDSIACDAELQEKPLAELKKLGEVLEERCKAMLNDTSEALSKYNSLYIIIS